MRIMHMYYIYILYHIWYCIFAYYIIDYIIPYMALYIWILYYRLLYHIWYCICSIGTNGVYVVGGCLHSGCVS